MFCFQLSQDVRQLQHSRDGEVWFHQTVRLRTADPDGGPDPGVDPALNVRVQGVSHHHAVLRLHAQQLETRPEDGRGRLLLGVLPPDHHGVEELLAPDRLQLLPLSPSLAVGQQQQLVSGAEPLQEAADLRGQTQDLQAAVLPQEVAPRRQGERGAAAQRLRHAFLPVTRAELVDGSNARPVFVLQEELLLELLTDGLDGGVIQVQFCLQELTGL